MSCQDEVAAKLSALFFISLHLMQGYDILEDMFSPKTSVANFAHDLCAKKRSHLDKFMAAVVTLMQQYVATAASTNNAGVPMVRFVVDAFEVLL